MALRILRVRAIPDWGYGNVHPETGLQRDGTRRCVILWGWIQKY